MSRTGSAPGADSHPDSHPDGLAVQAAVGEMPTTVSAMGANPPEGAGPRYVWLLVLAFFGVFVAFVAPLALSLAVRVQQLAPQNQEYLGYITGAGATAAVISAPFVGILSDRTRSRFGRRRPVLVVGAVVGAVSLVVMAAAGDVLTLGAGWVLAQLGWGSALNALLFSQADRLSEEQRGKVSGLTGFVQMVAPVAGAGMAAVLVNSNYLMFLVPGIFGVVFVALFAIFVGGDDSRDLAISADHHSFRIVLGKFLFVPRRYPDFSWNWLGRFFFNVGVTFSTTFVAFFLAARMGMPLQEIAGWAAILSFGGVAATGIGALGGGYLSDRLRRRRVFVLAAGMLFTVGSLLMAFGGNLVVLFAGSMITSIGLGAFSAVDQALVLDVLPERETDAGRFLGINGFSTSIPQAVAPLLASMILVVGVSGSERNYTLLFLVAAGCTLVGGVLVLAKVVGTR